MFLECEMTFRIEVSRTVEKIDQVLIQLKRYFGALNRTEIVIHLEIPLYAELASCFSYSLR